MSTTRRCLVSFGSLLLFAGCFVAFFWVGGVFNKRIAQVDDRSRDMHAVVDKFGQPVMGPPDTERGASGDHRKPLMEYYSREEKVTDVFPTLVVGFSSLLLGGLALAIGFAIPNDIGVGFSQRRERRQPLTGHIPKEAWHDAQELRRLREENARLREQLSGDKSAEASVQPRKCPACGAATTPDADRCPECQTALR